MKKLSIQLLADTVVSRRKAGKITQAQLSKATGINRGLLSRLESLDYVPSIDQLQALGEALDFDPTDIMSPSPHTYWYTYEGENHFYIPDFYIPSLNLEIEIKEGTNMHPKNLAVDKVKEQLKDDVMKSNASTFNYLKIVEKDNQKFLRYLLVAKENFMLGRKSNIVML